jgi:tRNA threonylcarbamoyl adenosine modification protein (Sua5/YciO/YrdC/YwlC family)
VAQLFAVHPTNPQLRLLRQAAALLNGGAVGVIPTDSCYALVCQLDDKEAVERVRRIRQVDARHHLTLLCRDLSQIAQYARVENSQYRLLKAATPGPYTFILEATREVPRRLSHPSRKTIGLRVPDHAVALALLEELGQPLISTTLLLPGEDTPHTDAQEIREQLQHAVDFVIDGGSCGVEPTTVIDLSGKEANVVRTGRGSLDRIGLAIA